MSVSTTGAAAAVRRAFVRMEQAARSTRNETLMAPILSYRRHAPQFTEIEVKVGGEGEHLILHDSHATRATDLGLSPAIATQRNVPSSNRLRSRGTRDPTMTKGGGKIRRPELFLLTIPLLGG